MFSPLGDAVLLGSPVALQQFGQTLGQLLLPLGREGWP
jgi:hypothetical protein